MSVNSINNKKIIKKFVVSGLLLIIPVLIKIYFDFIRDNSINKNEVSMPLYNYKVNDNDTELYKTNYKELKNVLNEDVIDYKKYAELLSKLFIIDVFNLDNKVTGTDIGGVEFIHRDLVSNFKDNMSSTLYSFVESDIEGNRKQDLPIVKSVIVSNIFETSYTYNDKEYEAYLVSVKWEYEKDLGYQSNIKLTLIKYNDMLYIVKGE